MEAVKQYGRALQFASDELRGAIRNINEDSNFDIFDNLFLLCIKIVVDKKYPSWIKNKGQKFTQSIKVILLTKGFTLSEDEESILSIPIKYSFPAGYEYLTNEPNLNYLIGKKIFPSDLPALNLGVDPKSPPEDLSYGIISYLANIDLVNFGLTCKHNSEFLKKISIITPKNFTINDNNKLLKKYLACIKNESDSLDVELRKDDAGIITLKYEDETGLAGQNVEIEAP
jgi:hypothetical protein